VLLQTQLKLQAQHGAAAGARRARRSSRWVWLLQSGGAGLTSPPFERVLLARTTRAARGTELRSSTREWRRIVLALGRSSEDERLGDEQRCWRVRAGKIYCEKVKSGPDTLRGLTLEYDEDLKTFFDPIVEHVNATFRTP
jgi:hypothetical protein